LNAAQLTMAQGIAYSAAAGNRDFTTTDAWTKRFEAGWPASSAITAALLARHGFIGSRTPYEGKFGVFSTYLNTPAAAVDVAAIGDGLGETWEFPGIMIKMLPSCYFNHAIINSTLAIVAQHNLQARDIRGIRVLVPQAAVDTVCEPRAAKHVPRDIATAQFSIYFSAACAAVRRRFTLDEMNPETLADPEILALAQKVEYAIDAQSTFPAHYSGGVEITTVDGRSLTAREDVNLGTAERPLAASAVEEKFFSNAQRVMPRSRAQEIRDLLLNIEACEDISAITARLGAA
jgi:2-methylcitrate dehydratase PrpD